ncbi:MAG TPA: hypothetical protein VEU72_08245 [Nitrosopumilaceae archaeon]|nr:hypothetical protein [Nitrosopumilaceae archaeon]
MKEITEQMLRKMSNDVTNLKEGLNPENIAFWYKKAIDEAKDMAPPWLVDKIKVKQDPILHMKFNLDISKRAVRYLMMTIENHIDEMPYSTRLYFLKVQEILTDEMNKTLV